MDLEDMTIVDDLVQEFYAELFEKNWL
jgi:hypothetical protein